MMLTLILFAEGYERRGLDHVTDPRTETPTLSVNFHVESGLQFCDPPYLDVPNGKNLLFLFKVVADGSFI